MTARLRRDLATEFAQYEMGDAEPLRKWVTRLAAAYAADLLKTCRVGYYAGRLTVYIDTIADGSRPVGHVASLREELADDLAVMGLEETELAAEVAKLHALVDAAGRIAAKRFKERL